MKIPEYLNTQLRAAKSSARKQGPFKVKHLNRWTGTLSAWFDVPKWMAGSAPIEQKVQEGFSCFIGLDLASRKDLAALQVLFPLPNDCWYTFGKYYLPLETAKGPGREAHLAWGKENHICLTDGTMIDFDQILEDALTIAKLYKVIQIGVDPYQSTMLAGKLNQEGQDVVLYGQTIKNLSYPMKTVDSSIVSGRMGHDGNPCMEWMMGNVLAREDLKQNVFPRKEREINLIDGPVALIMAMGIAQQHETDQLNNPPTRSVYEDRGLLSLG